MNTKFGLCFGGVLLGLILILSSKDSSNNLNGGSLCDLPTEGEIRGSFKGIVTNVVPNDIGQRIVTISSGQYGCSAVAIGTPHRLKNLNFIGERVSFSGNLKNGLISNISNVKKDYSVIDSNGEMGEIFEVTSTITNANISYYHTAEMLVLTIGNVRYIGSKRHALTLKMGEINTIKHDGDRNIISIN